MHIYIKHEGHTAFIEMSIWGTCLNRNKMVTMNLYIEANYCLFVFIFRK